MKNLLFFLCCAVTTTLAQTKNVGEQLGYPANAKLLIIHADDLGVSHSENDASIAAMEKGSVNSASIMVPCPWFPEIAAYAAAHPSADFGLHLTLTAEWKYYKWGTVAAPNEVKGLLTDKNYFHDNVEAVVSKASPAEVEKELRAQIERARQFGIDVTHFDTHMGTLLATPEFAKVYIRLGHEYKVPVLLHRGLVEANLKLNLDDYLDKNDVVLDNIFIASPADYKKGMKDFYINVLKTLPAGLNCVLLHAAYDNPEMQAVTIDHPDYGAAWRQADYDFFASEDCRRLLKEQNIQLVTWREIRDKVVRK